MHTYEIMRAIRFSGRGKTEAPFSCLLAPKLLTNMWLIMLGSGMTMAVSMLRSQSGYNVRMTGRRWGLCAFHSDCLCWCLEGPFGIISRKSHSYSYLRVYSSSKLTHRIKYNVLPRLPRLHIRRHKSRIQLLLMLNRPSSQAEMLDQYTLL